MIHMKKTIALLLTFVISVSLLWGFMEICARIPNAAIKENMIRSSESYKNKDAFGLGKKQRLMSVQDNFADAILLGVAWSMGENGGIDTKYYDGGELGVNAGLYIAINRGAEPNTDYTRYWHGNAGIARIFHLFTDVEGMKNISFLVILALAVFTAGLLFGRKCPRTAVCFILSIVCVEIWNVRSSLEYQPAFVIAMSLCALFILLEKKGDAALLVPSVIGGVFTAFFDFLTVETLPILLPLVLVLAVRVEQGRGQAFRENMIFIIKCGSLFVLAYVCTFLSKWSIASLLAGENKFVLAAQSAGVRFGAEKSAGFLSGIPANLTVLFGGTKRIEPARVVLGMALSLGVLGSLFYLFRSKHFDRGGMLAFLILGAVVFVRYAVLQNHSYLHEFFTYRALASTICAVFCTVALCNKNK